MAHIFKPKLFTLFSKGFTQQQIVSDIMAGTIVGNITFSLPHVEFFNLSHYLTHALVMISGTHDKVFRDLKKHGVLDLIGGCYVFKRFDSAISYAKEAIKGDETHS